MKKIKLFKSGDSQWVRLPREFRFTTDEVVIKREGAGVMLVPKLGTWLPKPRGSMD